MLIILAANSNPVDFWTHRRTIEKAPLRERRRNLLADNIISRFFFFCYKTFGHFVRGSPEISVDQVNCIHFDFSINTSTKRRDRWSSRRSICYRKSMDSVRDVEAKTRRRQRTWHQFRTSGMTSSCANRHLERGQRETLTFYLFIDAKKKVAWRIDGLKKKTRNKKIGSKDLSEWTAIRVGGGCVDLTKESPGTGQRHNHLNVPWFGTFGTPPPSKKQPLDLFSFGWNLSITLQRKNKICPRNIPDGTSSLLFDIFQLHKNYKLNYFSKGDVKAVILWALAGSLVASPRSIDSICSVLLLLPVRTHKVLYLCSPAPHHHPPGKHGRYRFRQAPGRRPALLPAPWRAHTTTLETFGGSSSPAVQQYGIWPEGKVRASLDSQMKQNWS